MSTTISTLRLHPLSIKFNIIQYSASHIYPDIDCPVSVLTGVQHTTQLLSYPRWRTLISCRLSCKLNYKPWRMRTSGDYRYWVLNSSSKWLPSSSNLQETALITAAPMIPSQLYPKLMGAIGGHLSSNRPQLSPIFSSRANNKP